MAFDETNGQAQLALELVEMAVEQADFAFVERGRAQFGGSSQEQLGGGDDFAVGMLHGFHHIAADVAFAGCGGQMTAAFDHAGVDFAHFNHVLFQTLARHALAVADFGNHFGAVGEVVGKHEAPHQGRGVGAGVWRRQWRWRHQSKRSWRASGRCRANGGCCRR